MNPCELAAIITAIAITVSNKLNTNELTVLSSILIQLGDTLATIAAQRILLENNQSCCNSETNLNNCNK